jgi:predicted dehydrogenase
MHADAIRSTDSAEVSCICVRRKELVPAVRRTTGVEVYADYDEFLEKGETDVVDITSPNYLHAQHAISAMKRKKDVLIEKPIATNLEDGRRLLDVQKEMGCAVQVGFEYRYAPFWRAFKLALDQEKILRPGFSTIKSWRGPLRDGSGGWRYDKARVGHQFLEIAIHYFDIALWNFGMPRAVSGFSDSSATWEQGTFKEAVAVLEYPDGLRVVLEESLNGISDFVSMTVSGEGAMMGVTQSEWNKPAAPWVMLRDKSGVVTGEKVEDLGEEEALILEVQDFARVVRGGSRPSANLEDGFRALLVNLAAIEAIGSGERVRIPKSGHNRPNAKIKV